jgi:hypothetical protein
MTRLRPDALATDSAPSARAINWASDSSRRNWSTPTLKACQHHHADRKTGWRKNAEREKNDIGRRHLQKRALRQQAEAVHGAA